VALLALCSVLVTAGPASAHVVVASVFARPPTCRPSCASAHAIAFHARIRLDDCNVEPCLDELALSGWAEIRTGAGWRPVRRATRTEALSPSGSFGIRITIACRRSAAVSRVYRMEALGGVVGDHRFETNTPNPDRSAPMRVRCADGEVGGPGSRFRGSLYA
jgi:hypothetical protein